MEEMVNRLEAMVGTEKRLKLVAQDIVDHWERRKSALLGKGMIVAMSRRIAVDLYNEIIKLRPQWHGDRDDEGPPPGRRDQLAWRAP